MVKNRLILKYFTIFITIVLFSLIEMSCQRTMTAPRLDKNNIDVINYRDFFLDTASMGLNTYVRGTIFIKHDENNPSKYHIQIVSWVEIDPKDGRGISFYVPNGWYVSAINTSFPEGNPKPEMYTSVWYNEYFNQYPEKGQPIFIQIGGSTMIHLGDAYGQGNVIIEIESISTKQGPPDNIEIEVSAGTQLASQLNHAIIPVAFNVDYRAPSP